MNYTNNIRKNIQESYLSEEEVISKAIEVDEIMKGKKANLGEVRTWGGKKYQKTTSGWKHMGEGNGGDKFDHTFFDDYKLSGEERSLVLDVKNKKRPMKDLTNLHDNSSNIDQNARNYLQRFMSGEPDHPKMSKIKMNHEIMQALKQLGESPERLNELVSHYGSQEKLHSALGDILGGEGELPKGKNEFVSSKGTIRLKDDGDMPSSMWGLQGRDLKVKGTKKHEFASGTQTYYIVESRTGNDMEVPERFLKKQLPDSVRGGAAFKTSE